MNTRMKLKVLLAGESWTSIGLHAKGFAVYTTADYEEGGQSLIDALRPVADVVYLNNHRARVGFPSTASELAEFDVIVLSDCPSDTLLLPPEVFNRSEVRPNRLLAIQDFVQGGGGFAMVGGYMSFAGLTAQAKYFQTPIETILPVRIARWDDRIECPQGVTPQAEGRAHPILDGIKAPWPRVLGYNRVEAKEDGIVLMRIEDAPFLVVGTHGKGRTAAYASDCSPHWAPEEFVAWEHYARFWQQLVGWLAGK
jgi:uncharacterized membrane protein